MKRSLTNLLEKFDNHLWCWVYNICYKHGVEKEANINALRCPVCVKEATKEYKERLEQFRQSRLAQPAP